MYNLMVLVIFPLLANKAISLWQTMSVEQVHWHSQSTYYYLYFFCQVKILTYIEHMLVKHWLVKFLLKFIIVFLL